MLWQSCIAAGALALSASIALAQDQPNLIFILTDDQGIDAVEGQHWPNQLNCQTPNLATWASQGRVFTQARVNPLCSPTRAALMTGRHAIRTGVNDVINEFAGRPDRDRLSLHPQERTIAEVLHDLGYYTVLVDKWHLGWTTNQYPQAQGFDVYLDYNDFIHLDDPDEVGDEHTTRMVNMTIDVIQNRPDPDQPFALFYWSIDAHARPADSDGLVWWDVDPSLVPGEPAPDIADNVERYRRVVAALDTELGRMLRTLGVVDAAGAYVDASDTVVAYLGDNGTPREVSPAGDRAKGSPYESGIRVPCFFFGEGIPSDGLADDRLVSHVDFFDTFADIVSASDEQRGDAPRDGMSFADRIGYAQFGSLPEREYSLSSIAPTPISNHRVALVSRDYKLITRSGGFGLDDRSTDEFYHLAVDPAEEFNLIEDGMTGEQLSAYLNMRDIIVDHWPSAVSESWRPDDFALAVVHDDEQYRLIVFMTPDGLLGPENDEFYDLVNDPNGLVNLLEHDMSPQQQAAYNALRAAAEAEAMSSTSNDTAMRTVDVPLSHTLVLTESQWLRTGPLTVGHADVGGAGREETRAFLRFDITSLPSMLPPDATVDDIIDAQIIVAFNSDATTGNATDTGPIRIYPVTIDWAFNRGNWRQLGTAFEAVVLGEIDPAPFIINNPPGERPAGLPWTKGTPVSFGHNDNLVDYVINWINTPSQNYGVTLIAEPLEDLQGDQRINFLRVAGLRLTLRD